MTERPIIFNGEMVRAILNGSKTQTRRPVHKDIVSAIVGNGGNVLYRNPFGKIGDQLWVREKFQPFLDGCDDLYSRASVDYKTGKGYSINYPATDGVDEFECLETGNISSACKPSIHMPRWASRIDLEITNIRIERLQDITEKDAWAEGCTESISHSAKFAFQFLWNSIYNNYISNPWVWVVEFKRIEI